MTTSTERFGEAWAQYNAAVPESARLSKTGFVDFVMRVPHLFSKELVDDVIDWDSNHERPRYRHAEDRPG